LVIREPGPVPEDSGFAHTTTPVKDYAEATGAQQYLPFQICDYAIARAKGLLLAVVRITRAKYLSSWLRFPNYPSYCSSAIINH
jgi:hypothetical protein